MCFATAQQRRIAQPRLPIRWIVTKSETWRFDHHHRPNGCSQAKGEHLNIFEMTKMVLSLFFIIRHFIIRLFWSPTPKGLKTLPNLPRIRTVRVFMAGSRILLARTLLRWNTACGVASLAWSHYLTSKISLRYCFQSWYDLRRQLHERKFQNFSASRFTFLPITTHVGLALSKYGQSEFPVSWGKNEAHSMCSCLSCVKPLLNPNIGCKYHFFEQTGRYL